MELRRLSDKLGNSLSHRHLHSFVSSLFLMFFPSFSAVMQLPVAVVLDQCGFFFPLFSKAVVLQSSSFCQGLC